MSSTHSFSLESNNILEFGSFHVTNSMLAAFVTSILVVIIAILATRKASLVPTRLQSVMELMVETFQGMLVSAYGTQKRARKYLPYILTLFLFLLVANQFAFLPLLMSITTEHGALFRPSTSDWSQTIALALITLTATHLISLSISPLKHLGHFIRLKAFLKIRKPADIGNAFFEFFLGILEIIGEIAKLISLSARLFGNIFSGEILIAVIAGLSIYTTYLVPVPFMGLVIFEGLVQAFVFALLTVQLMALNINAVSDDSHEKESNLQNV